ncbi:MAG: YkgJ family cysteine cluster protein [Promethearchaeota archaeon]
MSSTPKFIFECLSESCPDRKCCNRSSVMIFFEDIKRWVSDQSMNIVYPNLEYILEGGFPMIVLKKYPNETLCAMFNKETNNCNIYYSKPISCVTFPLGFNGNAFFVMDKECPGLGKGKMTKEALIEMRKQAKLYYECRTRTSSSLTLVNELFLRFFEKQQRELMDKLSDEDKKKIAEKFLQKEEKPPEEVKEKPPEETKEKPPEEVKEKPPEEVKEKPPEEAKEKPPEETKEKPPESKDSG